MKIIIPIKNERENILNIVKSIPSEYIVYSVFNGTTDLGDELLNEYISQNNIKNVNVLYSEPGKCKAINKALGLINDPNEFILHFDSDISLDNNFWQVLESIDLSEYKLIGALDYPNTSNLITNSLLENFLNFEQISRVARGRKIVIGRCFGYRRGEIDFFPEGIHSEDNWISFHIASKFGWGSIKIFPELKISYKPASDWVNLLEQKIRFEKGFFQIMEKFPEFEKIYENRRDSNDKFDKKYFEENISKLKYSTDELSQIQIVLEKMIDDSIKSNEININDIWTKIK